MIFTKSRVERDVVAVPDDAGPRLGVGDLAGELHLLVLPHLQAGAGQGVYYLDPGGRHCSEEVQYREE